VKNLNKSKFYSGRNKEQIEVRECLLSFGAEFCVLQFLSKNIKIKIYRTINFPVVLCGCKNWSLTLREEPRLRMFENRVLRRIFGPKRDEVMGNGENYVMRSLTLRLLMSYIYGAPILDVSRSHTTTQHSR